jgi:hypothetical protein
MAQINVEGGPHGITTLNQGTADEARFWGYAASGRQLNLLQRAVSIIQNNIYKKNVSCNHYFKKLSLTPPSRSFDEVWEDANIWISYEPRTGLGWDCVTNFVFGKEITLGEDAFTKGNVWYLTAVLVHELAHTNGAGGAPSIAASTSLKFCGLIGLYDGAIGAKDNTGPGPANRVV